MIFLKLTTQKQFAQAKGRPLIPYRPLVFQRRLDWYERAALEGAGKAGHQRGAIISARSPAPLVAFTARETR